MRKYDVVLLTDSRYVSPGKINPYIRNVLSEDETVQKSLRNRGLRTWRTNWDNQDFDWSCTRFVLFRSTWDYFDRFTEFSSWLDRVNRITSMINPFQTIRWNIDKHYLLDLQDRGISIPPTLFIEAGDKRPLNEIIKETGWDEIILKPAVSGGARHTYRIRQSMIVNHEFLYKKLIAGESMLIQEFQQNVIDMGEVAYMVFGGKYSHAVLKKAREGDFRVQDDFGGSVHDYKASLPEMEFAEKVVSACDPLPVYARVDVIRDSNYKLCVSELELIEPELWFRHHLETAETFADAVMDLIGRHQ